MGEEVDHEWELVLEEYKSLREEQLNKMDKQYQITGLGIGGIATLLAAAYQEKVYPLFLILPLVILALMALYEAESCAIIRAGEYIKKVETSIINSNKDLGWERWLSTKDAQASNFCSKGDTRQKDKAKIYNLIDHSSRLILFILYIGCILGIITFPERESVFWVIGGNLFRSAIAGLYIIIGLSIFLIYTLEQSKKRSALAE